MIGDEALVVSSFFNFLIVVIVIIAVSSAISAAFKTRKSQNYRKFITDMYVAAKIRFFAKEDNLDLTLEEANFKDWAKRSKRKSEGYDLDNAVEDELIDRVENTTKKEKKKDKKEDKTE